MIDPRRDLLRRLELEELDLARRDPLPLQDRQHRIVGRGALKKPMVLPLRSLSDPTPLSLRATNPTARGYSLSTPM